MTRLADIFDISKPKTLALSWLELSDAGIPIISSAGTNNGVVAFTEDTQDVQLYKAPAITVPLKGTVLAAFVQTEDFYCLHQIAVLHPKVEMTQQEMYYFALCIRHNAARYSYGRQADRTLSDLLVPSLDEIPSWVNETEIPTLNLPPIKKEPLDTSSWQWFKYSDLFDIKRGNISSLGDYEEGETPVVTASSTNNGVSAWIDREADFEGGVITVSAIGDCGNAFYQEKPCCVSVNTNVLIPKFEMSENVALFLCTLIRLEKPRYNYGYNLSISRTKESKIKLPVTPDLSPDWQWMEEYMQQFEGLRTSL